MNEYNPQERMMDYHLGYYFELLDNRRSLESNIDQIKEAGSKIEQTLENLPFLSKLNLDSLPKLTYECDSKLVAVAENISKLWDKIEVGGHALFTHSMAKNAAEEWKDQFKDYPVKFYATPSETPREEAHQIYESMKQELSISDASYSNATYKGIYEMTVNFPSVNEAIRKTKIYLLGRLE